jgi:hypothetical protein
MFKVGNVDEGVVMVTHTTTSVTNAWCFTLLKIWFNFVLKL